MNANKRPRTETDSFNTFNMNKIVPTTTTEIDDDWDDWDDDAIENCVILATQMCATINQEESEKVINSTCMNPPTTATTSTTFHNSFNQSQTVNTSKPSFSQFTSNNNSNNNNSNNNNNNNNNNILSTNISNNKVVSTTKIVDRKNYKRYPSGFSSFNPSKLNNNNNVNFTNNPQRPHSNNNTITNSNQTTNINKPSMKVYNSVPSQSNFHSNVKLQSTKSDNLSGIDLKRNKTSNVDESLRDQLQTKQGEVLLLRSQLKQKDAAIETERLERCTAIQTAQNNIKEKSTSTIAEGEKKIKDLERTIDRLQSDLLFKNRESDELITKCRRLDQQVNTSVNVGSITTSQVTPRNLQVDTQATSSKRSHWLDNKFDFSHPSRSVCNVETQTESSQPTTNKRLNLKTSGKPCFSRYPGYLLASHGYTKHLNSKKYTNYSAKTICDVELIPNGCDEVPGPSCGTYTSRLPDTYNSTSTLHLPPEWSRYLASVTMKEESSKDSPTKDDKILASLKRDFLRSILQVIEDQRLCSNEAQSGGDKIVLSYLHPALVLLRGLVNSSSSVSDIGRVVHLVSTCIQQQHVVSTCIQQQQGNEQNVHLLHEALNTLIVITSTCSLSGLQTTQYEDLVKSFIRSFPNVGSPSMSSSLLVALTAITHDQNLREMFCWTKDDCLLASLCDHLKQRVQPSWDEDCCDSISCSHSVVLNNVTKLLEFVNVLGLYAPKWFISLSCHCSTTLLTTLLSMCHGAVSFMNKNKCTSTSNEVCQLLGKLVKCLHCWQCVDPNWWDRVATVPLFTILMKATLTCHNSVKSYDILTVNQLGQLYEDNEIKLVRRTSVSPSY